MRLLHRTVRLVGGSRPEISLVINADTCKCLNSVKMVEKQDVGYGQMISTRIHLVQEVIFFAA